MMVKLAMSQMQTVAVVFMASLWMSAVHCHVLDQMNRPNGDDSATDEDTNWPVLCPEDSFYDRTRGLCVKCSQCPMNQVITSPCQGLYDTQCGPFIIFQNFGSSNYGQGDEKTGEMESNKNLDTDANRKHLKVKNDSTSGIDIVVSEEKSFSLTLIIILGIVLAIFFLVIGITCYVRHKSSRTTKEVQCEYKPAPSPVSV